MAEEKKQELNETVEAVEEEVDRTLEDGEEEDAEDVVEEKNMDHIKGVFNYTRPSGREYRVVFYKDRKNLMFRELGNEKVEFVGRFTSQEYDETNEEEMRAFGEKKLDAILKTRGQ